MACLPLPHSKAMSTVKELRLLKAQVQDVAQVCNAVARGDLSQEITVLVQGVVKSDPPVSHINSTCFRVPPMR